RGPISDGDWDSLLVSYGGRRVQYLPGQTASACLLDTRPCAVGTRDGSAPAVVSRAVPPPEDAERVRDRHKYDFPPRPAPLGVGSVCYLVGPDQNDTTWEL